MSKLLQNKIIKTEEKSLSEADKSHLVTRKNKQLKFILVSYIPLALILAYVFINGLEIIYRERYPFSKHEVTEDEVSQFNTTAPIVCGFFFLLLTGYFLKIYLQQVAPLFKDIKSNKKLLVTVETEKTDMGALNKYYISTPIKEKRHIAIGKNDFSMLSDHEPLILEIAPHSTVLFRISNNGNDVAFN